MISTVSRFLIVNLVSVPTANAVLSNPTPVCVSGTCTINFDTTGDYYLWSAPTTGTYTFQVWGAQGGNAGYDGTVYREGGKGGYAEGSINLVANQPAPPPATITRSLNAFPEIRISVAPPPPAPRLIEVSPLYPLPPPLNPPVWRSPFAELVAPAP